MPLIKNYSINTIHSYRDTFKLLLMYFNDELNIPTHKIQIKNITPDSVRPVMNKGRPVTGHSGYCEYPLYEFDDALLGSVAAFENTVNDL